MKSLVFVAGLVVALAVAMGVVAFNMYGALTLTPIPPGRMSVFTYIGLKDLQRGVFSGEALKFPALLAYVLRSLGVGEFTATKGAALLSLAALPLAGGLFGYVATRSKLVAGASAILLSLIPFTYLSAIGGDYTFVSALALVQFSMLFSLLLMKEPRKLLTAVWFVLSAAAAVLVGVDMESASVLLLITAVVWAAYTLFKKRFFRSLLVLIPGAVAAVANLASPQDPTEALRLISPISTLSPYELLLGILVVAGAAGGVALAYRTKMAAVPALSFVLSGAVLLPSFGAEAFLLVFPGVVVLAMVPLKEANGLLKVVKEAGAAGEESVFVEVHFEKFVAFAFAIIMLSSPFVTGLGPGTAVQGTNYLGNEELQTISRVGTLNSSLFGQGVVAAPSSIAPWLRADLGVNALLALSPDEAALADAITSTSFRLRNSYLMVDEWTPFSSVRSPFIYAFDGSTYGAILHLDDGTNRVNLSTPQGPRSDDMSGSYMTSHEVTQNGTGMTLTMDMTKVGFNVTKQISLANDGPALTISYDVVPNLASPTSMVLPVYIEGEQTISQQVSGDAIHLSLGSANFTLTFPGGSTPELVRGPTQDYVRSTFNATGGEVRAFVSIEVQSAKSSGLGAFYSSLLDTLREEGVSSLLSFTTEPGLNFIGAASGPQMTLDIKDAFNRILYAANGTNYVESPANARVLSQAFSNSSCAATFNYETYGLDIQKDVSGTNDSVSLAYSVHPRNSGSSLEKLNMTFWIPFGRTLLGYSTTGGSLTLRLDGGTVTVTPTSGKLTGVEVGPDPIYGQLRAVLTFSLNPSSDKVGATMQFGKAVSCKEVLSTRPVINGTDELQLFTLSAPFLQVFSNQYFTIYQVNAGELPP